MIRAIIFDYDGVIVDSFASVFRVYQKICEHFRVPCPETIEGFRKVYGRNYRECMRNLGIPEEKFAEAISMYERGIVEMEFGVFDGISAVLKELSVRHKLFLVSASRTDEIVPRLEANGIKDCFERVYSSVDQGSKKSELMKEVLREYGYAPDDVISVGDRANDYTSSRKAGIEDENIILVDYGWGLDATNVGQANIVHSPDEIAGIVRGRG